MWTIKIKFEPRKHNNTAVAVGDKIYIFDAFIPGKSYDFFDESKNSIFVMDAKMFIWKKVVYEKSIHTPTDLSQHTIVTYEDKIYLWGSNDKIAAPSTMVLSCFNTHNLKWTSPFVTGNLPPRLKGHSACVIKNQLLIHGGLDFDRQIKSKALYCLNLDTMQWKLVSTKGVSLSWRYYHTAVSVGARMYIFGGHSSDLDVDWSRKIFYLDTVTGTWFSIESVSETDFPAYRISHSSWTHNGCIYIYGGARDQFETLYYEDFWCYSILKNQWRKLNVAQEKAPGRRKKMACVKIEDKVYLFGGQGSELDVPTPYWSDDFHVFDYLPSLKTLSMLNVRKNCLDQACLPNTVKQDLVLY